ncbi:MAG: peptidoglycan editing factor PgeF [Myxococcaceae bacterium]|nr:peptidoglycan editing factor PgeF [Myxococcaceae bacterium]
MELIRSKVIRVPHGFPTRHGGVSTGPFASLNASTSVGDDAASVAENVKRLAAAVGATPQLVATAHQVHGVTVLEATAAGEGALPPPVGEADALVTRAAGLTVGVKTADCLPILVEDPLGRQVAAVHAGWRGVIGDVLGRTLDRLVASGARVDELRVAIGPAIGPCCFEVDGDLPQRFEAAFGAGVVRRVAGKPKVHLDLAWAVAESLRRRGLPDGHVDALPHCTRCDERFFSHRRDAGVTGRMLSLIRCAF